MARILQLLFLFHIFTFDRRPNETGWKEPSHGANWRLTLRMPVRPRMIQLEVKLKEVYITCFPSPNNETLRGTSFYRIQQPASEADYCQVELEQDFFSFKCEIKTHNFTSRKRYIVQKICVLKINHFTNIHCSHFIYLKETDIFTLVAKSCVHHRFNTNNL